MGGYLYPSVLRSPGATPQECRAAHGPLHPAVTNPPRLCWFCIWFFVMSLWDGCWVLCVGFFLSLGLACCLFFCPSGPDPCRPGCLWSPLSFFVFGLFDGDVFLSVFLSFRRWGNPNPFWGLGFPLCFRDHDLPLRSVLRGRHLHQGCRPPLLFFFRRRSFFWWLLVVVCRVCSGPLSLSWWFRSIVCLHASIRQKEGVAY